MNQACYEHRQNYLHTLTFPYENTTHGVILSLSSPSDREVLWETTEDEKQSMYEVIQ